MCLLLYTAMPSKSQLRRARLQNKKSKETQAATTLSDSTITNNTTNSNSSVVADSTTEPLSSVQSSVQLNTQEKSTTNPKTKEDFSVPRDKVLQKASELWNILKEHAKKNPDFKSLEDQEKLDLFRTKFGYALFMDEFPIVSKYMICKGQYSSKAFDRMLSKIEKTVHPPPDKREKGYMEDQWVRRQADYVQYLWESYQKRHQNTAERQFVWRAAYDNLKKEFDDFRNMHKEVEERVKEEKKTLAGQNVRELLQRVADGQQTLTSEEEQFLVEELRKLSDKKAEGLLDTKEDDNKDKFSNQKEPKILMIETVDADRMHEIDDKYKPPELRGMRTIEEEPEEQPDTAEVQPKQLEEQPDTAEVQPKQP